MSEINKSWNRDYFVVYIVIRTTIISRVNKWIKNIAYTFPIQPSHHVVDAWAMFFHVIVAFLFFSEKSTYLLSNCYPMVGWVSSTGFPDMFCQFTIFHKFLIYIYLTLLPYAMTCNFSYGFLMSSDTSPC